MLKRIKQLVFEVMYQNNFNIAVDAGWGLMMWR